MRNTSTGQVLQMSRLSSRQDRKILRQPDRKKDAKRLQESSYERLAKDKKPDRIFDMDAIRLKKQLVEISILIDAMLIALSGDTDQPKREPRSICPVCDEPFVEGETIQRGVHARCYKRASRENRVAELEKAGVLLPRNSGRKRSIDLETVIQKANSIGKKAGRNSKKNNT